jgi:hypothetical protein
MRNSDQRTARTRQRMADRGGYLLQPSDRAAQAVRKANEQIDVAETVALDNTIKECEMCSTVSRAVNCREMALLENGRSR